VPTKGFRNPDDLRRHFFKHGHEFNCATTLRYEEMAEAFLGGPLGPDAAECTQSGGMIVRYNDATREIGFVYPDGFIATYFIKQGSAMKCRQYFCESCKK
jgi:hypothetical protein